MIAVGPDHRSGEPELLAHPLGADDRAVLERDGLCEAGALGGGLALAGGEQHVGPEPLDAVEHP